MSLSEKGVCSICDEVFNDSELTEVDDLFLCTKDLAIYQENEWIPFSKTIVSAENANDALILQNLKDQFKAEGKPAYILSSYQEASSGEIQTVSTLFVIKS